MTQWRRILVVRTGPAVALALFLGACGAAPYIDSRREAGQRVPAGMSTPDLVAICYSGRSATPEDLQKLAESECEKTGRTAQLARQDKWSCTVAAPTRIFYHCVTKPPKP